MPSSQYSRSRVAPWYSEYTFLINAEIKFAKDSGMKTLEIGTGNPGVIQMMLYQKCGFKIVGVELDYFRKNHTEKIFENGIECRDMIRMRME